jgi:hypothetical protein
VSVSRYTTQPDLQWRKDLGGMYGLGVGEVKVGLGSELSFVLCVLLLIDFTKFLRLE